MSAIDQTGAIRKHWLYVERRDNEDRVEYRVVTDGVHLCAYASRWYASEDGAWQQVYIDWGPFMP